MSAALERCAGRGGGVIEPGRLFRNLLSSQPLCFNLFEPLQRSGELATCLERVLHLGIREIRELRFEHQPRLADGYRTGSAFDCFIVYEHAEGLGFLGVETKYAEDLSAQRPSTNADYAAFTVQAPEVFKAGAEVALAARQTSQLWYNTVLACRVAKSGRSGGEQFTEGRVLVLTARADASATAAVADLRAQLVEPDRTLVHAPYEDLLDAVHDKTELGAWRRHFTTRYLDLSLSNNPGE